ncbi:MAG TPA: adenine-specific methyltransferase EcoRI family protein [Anaerolineaceae bacterium]|nr:adenine-specific methyltransferase EcoRI family protein [Anaerolineaceae bacterium]
MESKNASLQRAAKAKADEFYTQLPDIEAELRHYKEHFKGKKILCNCDDPFESNFFKYFAMNFNHLGLAKLTATSYVDSPIAEGQLPLFEVQGLGVRQEEGKKPYKIEITDVRDEDSDGAVGLADVEFLLRNQRNTLSLLQGDGDFRSQECIELLKQADIVVTNPPFSLFREYVAQLVEFNKQFIIIGNVNAITYKETFKLIQNNDLWLGQSIHSGDREFRVPDHYPLEAAGFRVDENGIRYIRVKGVRWFTNLDYKDRHEPITLYRQYDPKVYPYYDNYDAINVNKVAEIPYDYEGVMGVPITFLDKYDPDQFKIIGLIAGNIRGLAGIPTKTGKDGPYLNGKLKYGRILIKRKGVTQ